MRPENDTHFSPINPRNQIVDEDGYPSKYFLDWLLKGLYMRVGQGSAITLDQLEALVSANENSHPQRPFELPEQEIPLPTNDGNIQKALEDLAEQVEAGANRFNTAAILQAIDGLYDLVANQPQQRVLSSGPITQEDVQALIDQAIQASEVQSLKTQIEDLQGRIAAIQNDRTAALSQRIEDLESATPSDDWGGVVVHRFRNETINDLKTFTNTITSSFGTVAVNTPAFTGTATWDDGGLGTVVFNGIKYNATFTSGSALSLLLNLQTSSSLRFTVDQAGIITGVNSFNNTFTSTITSGTIGAFIPTVTANPAGSSSANFYADQAVSQSLPSCAQNLTSSTGGLIGVLGECDHYGSGTLSVGIGVKGLAFHRSATSTSSDLRGGSFQVRNLGAGAVVAGAAVYIVAPTNAGTFTTAYGIRIEAMSAGATNYAIFTNGAGLVKFSDTTDASALGTAGFVLLCGASIAKQTWFGDNLNITDAKNIVLGTTTGTKFGTGTTQKLAFYNSTPIAQQASTVDIRTALINLGFFASGGANPLNLNGGAMTCAALSATSITQTGAVALTGAMTVTDAVNFVFGTTTGTQLGTGTTQKIGVYGATPIAQRAGAAQAAVATTGATNTTPYGYTTAAQADAIVTLVNELRAWAVAQGWIKGAA